ncbi:MAG: hypothetical protein JXR71_04935 [Bacteroidales bacterium]|nr:hypothetical protein [Bacteroidales bacterium]
MKRNGLPIKGFRRVQGSEHYRRHRSGQRRQLLWFHQSVSFVRQLPSLRRHTLSCLRYGAPPLRQLSHLRRWVLSRLRQQLSPGIIRDDRRIFCNEHVIKGSDSTITGNDHHQYIKERRILFFTHPIPVFRYKQSHQAWRFDIITLLY